MNDVWGVTVYFNPAGCKYRRATFDAFRRAFPLPLLCVEIATADHGPWLPDGESPLHVRRVGDCLWQKERGFNIGAALLPSQCQYILFTDADLIFDEPHTLESRVRQSLQHAAVAQGYTTLARLSRTGEPVDVRFGVVAGRSVPGSFPGGVWAFRRDAFTRLGGFYDRCIVGGGDCVLSYGLGVTANLWYFRQLSALRAAHVAAWQERVRMCSFDVDYIPGHVLHLWHGDDDQRQHGTRHALVREFDPVLHLLDTPTQGLQWSAAAPLELRQRVATYFMRNCVDAT